MTDTTNLALPCIEGSQAQKHVTHNDALRILDTLVQLAVLDRDLTVPPPTDGQRWIVKAGAAGAWTGRDNAIAAWQDGAWQFNTPRLGWLAFVTDEGTLAVWNGTSWGDFFSTITMLQNLALLGIGTTADNTNPLNAKLNNALFAAKTAGEGGSGDLRYKLSKESAANILSFLFQDNYSGRAEIGLTGDDDFHLKVSPDGSTFYESMVADRASGKLKFPAGIADVHTGALVSTFLPVPVVPELWRIDAARPATPRTYTISAVSGSTLTLTTGDIAQIFTTGMQNVSMVRIWNTSKTPAQPAWVKWNTSASQLDVLDATSIAAWSAEETVQFGDPNPTASNVLSMVAVDLSNYMYNNFGAVFRQKGVLLSTYVSGAGGDVVCDFSGTGAAGSATGGNSLSTGARNQANFTIVTPTLSPISNSNLLYIREQLGTGTAMGTVYARLMGFYV